VPIAAFDDLWQKKGFGEQMNNAVARGVINQELDKLRRLPYKELLGFRDRSVSSWLTGEDGKQYQMEVQAHWDRKKDGDLRVMVSIDDGGLRAFFPVSGDFIVSPDGSFVGEDSH
jgi:hypothetical protein